MIFFSLKYLPISSYILLSKPSLKRLFMPVFFSHEKIFEEFLVTNFSNAKSYFLLLFLKKSTNPYLSSELNFATSSERVVISELN